MRVKIIVKDFVDSYLQEVEFQDRVSLQDGTFFPGAVLDGVIFVDQQDEKALANSIRRGFYLIALINGECEDVAKFSIQEVEERS